MKRIFKITGMSCSACSASVERVVRRLDGVSRADVNLIAATLICEFDPQKVSVEQIITAVEKAGFSASLQQESSEGVKKTAKSAPARDGIALPSEKFRLIFSVCFLLPLMYVSMGRMISLPIPTIFMPENYPVLFVLIQALLALPVMMVNAKFFINGTRSIFKGHPNMDTLVATGSGASFLFGVFALFMIAYADKNGDAETVSRYVSNLYFESSAMILTLITVGKAFEAKSKKKTNKAVEGLKNLAPKTATILKDGVETTVDISTLSVGDVIVVKTGESVAADGIIVDGEGYLDTSVMTGESIPVFKTKGEKVFAATILVDGVLKVEVSATGGETSLSKIIDLVSEAGASKAPIAALADKISAVFVPVVMGISALTLIIWLLLGKPFEAALTNAVAVLVISCPCALGLATPVAVTVAIGAGARRGILIKSADVFERIAKTDVVVFDKTGTLTKGKPVLQSVCSKHSDELNKVALSLERQSSHPLAKAVTTAFDNVSESVVTEFKTVGGMGISGVIDGEICLGGNKKYLVSEGIDCDAYEQQAYAAENEGYTLLWFSKGKKALGFLCVSDEIRQDSAENIAKLKQLNLTTAMLTGDNFVCAEAVKEKLGMDYALSSLLPEDKERVLREISESGKKTVFVGDGINDSPAMARADVGIAVGSGTDVAIDSADVVLLKEGVKDVSTLYKMGKKTLRNIKQNLFWAFIYNVICIPVATGFLGINLSPMIAAAAMSVSSLFVVGNALRLNRMAKKEV